MARRIDFELAELLLERGVEGEVVLLVPRRLAEILVENYDALDSMIQSAEDVAFMEPTRIGDLSVRFRLDDTLHSAQVQLEVDGQPGPRIALPLVLRI